MKVFKSEPVTIKGCLKFGLKAVASSLYKHKCISISWDSDSSCTDGVGAIVSIIIAEKEALKRDIPLSTHPLVKDIAKYNKVDCQVLQEILKYIRENHTAPLDEEDSSDDDSSDDDSSDDDKIEEIEDSSDSDDSESSDVEEDDI